MDDDRISSLPDEILCHILSFLPTQQAVHTSVLSKRWIHLWTSVPVLDFDNRFHPFGFENFIHATIQARNLQQPITSFRLKYYQLLHRRPEDVKADINAWVNTVIDCGIENLEIRKEWERQPLCNFISLSCRILSCKTVVVLNLGRVSIAASSSVELPSLKSLRLNRAELKEPQYLMELLYGCPMLEDLHIYMLHYDHFGSVCKERFKILPKLVWADIWVVGMEIMDGNDVNVLLKTISNVKFLSISQFQVNDAVPEFPHLRDLTSYWSFIAGIRCF